MIERYSFRVDEDNGGYAIMDENHTEITWVVEEQEAESLTAHLNDPEEAAPGYSLRIQSVKGPITKPISNTEVVILDEEIIGIDVLDADGQHLATMVDTDVEDANAVIEALNRNHTHQQDESAA